MVRKAVILAAGLGTRLRPLTCSVPKPLMPVWGVPMLARIVELVRGWGVDDIVVNCHYLHEQVEAWCAANGCRASYEPEILGTGGVLNPLRDWIGEEAFYLVNGDIVMDGLDESKPFAESVAAGEIARCLVTEAGPRTIEIEPESGFVTNWKSDEPGFPGTWTYCGVALLSPQILKYVAPTGFSSIVTAYERAMADGLFVKTICPKRFLWTDAGTIASYIDVNRDGDENAFADFPQFAEADVHHLEFLGARGSDRVFFRDEGRVLILFDDAKRGENARYAGHARWLKAQGVPVPAVLQEDAAHKLLVLEWAGNEKSMSLEESVQVIKALVSFGALGEKASRELELEPPFDAALYRWERELFAEHCLGTRYRLPLAEDVRRELEQVAAVLEKEPMALVHRDFQSTNVLWKNGKLAFIDFQGMRLGSALYDLASFVYDPYVKRAAKERAALVKVFAQATGRMDAERCLPFAAVQRLVQCLGAYGRLAAVGQLQFSKFVLPALENLLEVADQAGLEALGALAEDLIAREMQSRHPHRHEPGCTCEECIA